jgi:hypothetical protein
MQYVQRNPGTKEESEYGGRKSSTFMTESAEQRPSLNSRPGLERAVAALMSASSDQRVCLWDLQGKTLGQLRQGDRGKAHQWHFPLTPEMIAEMRRELLNDIHPGQLDPIETVTETAN